MEMIGMFLLFFITGILLIVISIPMIRGKVKPNHWYGFRIRATLDNPDIWYPANAYAGKWLLVYGIAQAAAAVLVPIIWPTLSVDDYAIVLTVVLMVGLLIVFIASMRFVNSLKKDS
jgi:uncharacterized membrane protein